MLSFPSRSPLRCESISPSTETNWEGIGVVPDVTTSADEALETAHRLALEKLERR